jgi:hypothetical protein
LRAKRSNLGATVPTRGSRLRRRLRLLARNKIECADADIAGGVGGGYADCGLSDISFLWMVSKAVAAATDDGGRPLAFEEDYLTKKIDRRMGALIDSAGGKRRLLPKRVRAVMAKPPAGKETCELIHSSAVQRYKWPKAGSFTPFPYRPENVTALLDNP